MSQAEVRVRFAPSPTGSPHIGNIRTALFNWLFARHNGGKFIIRIEDTDQARKVEGALESILGSLRWLGLDWDEGPEKGGDYGPYFQSERRSLYQEHAQQLLDSGHAYNCYCSSERLAGMREEMARRKESMRSYDRQCRDLSPQEQSACESNGTTPVVRFRIPLEGRTTFHDLIHGSVTFDNAELDDLVLLKSDGYPTYHLANIVDDHFMKISHVLRADEWLSSTPKHALLYKAFGWEPPLFAHLPMILGPDKSKLSKRHDAAAVTEFQKQGYLPEAMLNFLALLGWSLDDKTEIFSREELVTLFSIERIGKTPAVFNRDKLDWLNGVHWRQQARADESSPFQNIFFTSLEQNLPANAKRHLSEDYVKRIIPLIAERVTTFGEAVEYSTFFFVDEIAYDTKLLLGKKMAREDATEALEAALLQLQDIAFDAGSLEEKLRGLASKLDIKAGDLFALLRVATTGRTATPPLFETMEVLGRTRCVQRMEAALSALDDKAYRHRSGGDMDNRPRFFMTVFGGEYETGAPVEKGRYSLQAKYWPSNHIPWAKVQPGDVLLLFCVQSYGAYDDQMPGIGVAYRVEETHETCTVWYRYLQLKEPMTRHAISGKLSPDDRDQFANLHSPYRRLFALETRSGSTVLSGCFLSWPQARDYEADRKRF